MWELKHFDELTSDEFYAIMHLRVAIFVVEQKRIYQEIDENDRRALHLFKLDSDGNVIAYARIFTIDNGQKVTFGRVAISKDKRGQGMGSELLHQIMDAIAIHFPGLPITIEAQQQVQGYYRKADFRSEGDVFIYQHTPHIKMVHSPLAK